MPFFIILMILFIGIVIYFEVTDDEAGLVALKGFIDALKTVSRVEILPYHTLGLFKWENLGIDYPLDGVKTPTDEEVKRAEGILGISTDALKAADNAGGRSC